MTSDARQYRLGMTDQHLFQFGFETPDQHPNNAEHDWDDQDSAAVWILSDNPKEALLWGEGIAEAYVEWLFSRAGRKGYSWREAGFASWIENDPETLKAASLIDIPVVRVGHMPELEKVGPRYGD